MKPHRLLALFLLSTLALPLRAFEKKPPPPRDANTYRAFETHDNEKLSIAAEPFLNTSDAPWFRQKYADHDLLPVRVIFTNNSDKALTLDQVRINYYSDDSGKMPAATEEEVNRRLENVESARGKTIPIGPIPITIRHNVDKKITQDFNEFGFASTVVQAHSTLAGFLFYDIQGVKDPLGSGEIDIKMVRTLDGKQEFFPFTIQLNKAK